MKEEVDKAGESDLKESARGEKKKTGVDGKK